MTQREPEDVDRGLKRWLWQEEQRWKSERSADVAAIAVQTFRNRERRPTKRERRAALALAEMANADAESITLTPKAAVRAREMLELEWADVAKLAGVITSVVVGFESSGRATTLERKRLQRMFEHEGLVFGRDGSVSWAE